MTQDEILYEIQKTLVRTKEIFPTRYEKRKGKDVMTEGVYVVNVQAFMEYLRANYSVEKITA